MSTSPTPRATTTPPRSLATKSAAALSGREGFVALTAAEEGDLARRAQAGDKDAGWTLVLANLNFVRSVAARYGRDDMELSDLVAEGVLGLSEAVARFDPERGIKFITYGVWWIKRSILTYLRMQGRPVHVPKYKEHEVHEVLRARRGLEQDLGRPAGLPDLAAATGLDETRVLECLGLASRADSLDGEDGAAIAAWASDTRNAEALAVEADSLEHLGDALGVLSEREAVVVRHRFGLDGAEERTLSSLALEMGVTKERVRQIEIAACTRLRAAMEGQPVPPAAATRKRLPRCA